VGADAKPVAPLKAVGLVSGGLDSTLAARLLQEQGVEVEAVHFSTGFCKVDHRRALKRPADRRDPKRLRNEALRSGADLSLPVEIIDVAEEYFRSVVVRPKHGYGSAMNPCIDCRIFMLRKAKELADARGAEVVFTGEVVGQRPMSQHHAALAQIEHEAGLEDRLLRPLSAKHLPPTRAERDGRIDRERLESANGRSRNAQLELAKRFGIDEFPSPSGGCCFLADRNFGRRLKDLLAHRDPSTIRQEDLLFLKVGRHFRLAHDAKLILGRDEPESTWLRLNAGSRATCQVQDGRGSFGVVEGNSVKRLAQIAALAARYSTQRGNESVEVLLRSGTGEQRIQARPATDAEAANFRI